MRITTVAPSEISKPRITGRSRKSLFLAFKAASIVLAKIQGGVSKHVREPPQAIPLGSRGLPSVTGIDAVPPGSRINFVLQSRYNSESEYRNLYHARDRTMGKEIYVKFTRRYSVDLHKFCVQEGLAPKLLGFQWLPGGWFGVVMEKVNVVSVKELESFSGLGSWKKTIGNLVRDFHQMDMVHGDLRFPNFIFTKDGTEDGTVKMLLVDFDWGGKAGEVYYPRGDLAVELRSPDGQDKPLDWPITKDDDNRVLAGAFEELDQLAAKKA